MHKHFKRQWFTQAIYLHIMLNISKHYLARNGDCLPTVCVACQNFAPQCMKLLGNLIIWHTILDWCLFFRAISAIAFRSLFSSNWLSKRTELYWNSSHACFLNDTFTFYAIGLLGKSCMWKRKKLQYKIPANSSSYNINSEYFRNCKKSWKLALLITSEDKSNKQQNQATHSFSLTAKPKLSTDLIFLSQQIWDDKKHVLVQLWLAVRLKALFNQFGSASRLNYSSPSTAVALENVHLPTTWQESELMFRNNGLLHHKLIIAAGLLSWAQCWQTTLVLYIHVFYDFGAN